MKPYRNKGLSLCYLFKEFHIKIFDTCCRFYCVLFSKIKQNVLIVVLLTAELTAIPTAVLDENQFHRNDPKFSDR